MSYSYDFISFIVQGFTYGTGSTDTDFGGYNSIRCRAGQIASFKLNSSISQNGLVVAMDFYSYSIGPANQAIFSIRDTTTNFVSLRAEYHSGRLNV